MKVYLYKIKNKISSNLRIYRNDLKSKGLYWSIIHRLYKLPLLKSLIIPLVNKTKPSFVFAYGHKIYIDKHDTTISQELLLSKKWEEFELSQFCKTIHPGDTVLDIGAHIGIYTLMAASIVGENGKVFAFEPDKKNFMLLQKNIVVNGYKNVVLINKAISDSNKMLDFYINPENTGDHRAYFSDNTWEKVTVEAITLDDYFMKEYPEYISKINVIKIDIQGSEYFALRGAKRIFSKNKYIKIFSEVWPLGLKLSGISVKNYLEMLQDMDYKFFDVREKSKKILPITILEIIKMYPESTNSFANILCLKET